MIFLFCRNIGFMRLIGSIKIPQMNPLSVASNRSRPFFGLLGFCNSFGNCVLSIQRWRCFSQIFNSVVRWISIYVIYYFWHYAMHKKKSNSMGVKQFSIHSKNNIPTSIACANWFFNVCNGKKQACIRVVIDMLKIIFVHAVVPFRQWFEKWRQGRQSLFSAPF